MQKKPKKTSGRAARTWTVQPDDDVRAAVEAEIERLIELGADGVTRTKIINTAVRKHLYEAVEIYRKEEEARQSKLYRKSKGGDKC